MKINRLINLFGAQIFRLPMSLKIEGNGHINDQTAINFVVCRCYKRDKLRFNATLSTSDLKTFPASVSYSVAVNVSISALSQTSFPGSYKYPGN